MLPAPRRSLRGGLAVRHACALRRPRACVPGSAGAGARLHAAHSGEGPGTRDGVAGKSCRCRQCGPRRGWTAARRNWRARRRSWVPAPREGRAACAKGLGREALHRGRYGRCGGRGGQARSYAARPSPPEARGAHSAPAHTLPLSDCYARVGPDCVRGSAAAWVDSGPGRRRMPERQEEPNASMPKRRAFGVLDSRLVRGGRPSVPPEGDTGFFSVGARDTIRLALGENDVAPAWAGRRGREQGRSGGRGRRSAVLSQPVSSASLSSARSPIFH